MNLVLRKNQKELILKMETKSILGPFRITKIVTETKKNIVLFYKKIFLRRLD